MKMQNFFQFEGRFQKALLSRRISVDSKPKHRNKAVFSNFDSNKHLKNRTRMWN